MTNTDPATQPKSDTIRDAATLIVVRDIGSDAPSILMGRRHSNAIFLPNKFVFPGGRFDEDDLELISEVSLLRHDLELLSDKPGAATVSAHVPALALTALRETFEETGVIIGKPAQDNMQPKSKAWRRFVDTGFTPDTSGLRFFARAITPPGRTRRYDTRFFVTRDTEIAQHGAPIDQELSEIDWVPLEDAHNKDVASITRLILKDLAAFLEAPNQARQTHQVPFYFFEDGSFRRVLLSHQQGPA